MRPLFADPPGLEPGLCEPKSAAAHPGSEVMDEIYYGPSSTTKCPGFYRKTNHAGGVEGGISNGMPILVTAAMKPIPTWENPLCQLTCFTKKSFSAAYERSDTCAVPAPQLSLKPCCLLVLADAFFEKFGGNSKKRSIGTIRTICLI